MISSTTLAMINMGIGIIVFPLCGFLWRLQVKVNKLVYDNEQHKEQHKDFKKKNEEQDKELTKLDKGHSLLEKDLAYIVAGVGDIKSMLEGLAKKVNE